MGMFYQSYFSNMWWESDTGRANSSNYNISRLSAQIILSIYQREETPLDRSTNVCMYLENCHVTPDASNGKISKILVTRKISKI